MIDKTEAKNHPFLFSPEMSRAIGKGIKRCTRREITRSRSLVDGKPCSKEFWEGLDFGTAKKRLGPSSCFNGVQPYLLVFRNSTPHRIYPRVQPGDIIWTKENHWLPPKKITTKMLLDGADTWPEVIYDSDDYDSLEIEGLRSFGWTHKSSLFQSRRHAKHTLLVLSVQPVRLHEITNDEILLEGVEPQKGFTMFALFRQLWIKINGKQSWETNPWLWRYGFERVK